jgi:hypothetical protein
MKCFATSTLSCLLVGSASSFARPLWGRSSEVAFAGRRGVDKTSSSMQATPVATGVEAKPEVMDADNWQLLSARGQAALARLVHHDEVEQAQAHVYSDWPAVGTDDKGKRQLAEQVCST